MKQKQFIGGEWKMMDGKTFELEIVRQANMIAPQANF